LHDLKIAVSLVQKLGFPFGVVINKALENNSIIRDYCHDEGLEILLEIPYSEEIAKSYSSGTLPVSHEEWGMQFAQLYSRIKERV
jgi:MinD superfamily P-loop ATPase